MIIITGVGQRIGLALAERFALAGQSVWGCYRTERPSLQRLRGLGVRLNQVDFYQPQQVDRWLTELQQLPSIRAVIHNASDWDSEDQCADLSDLFSRMMCVHAHIPYLLNHALAPALQQSPQADIIHISDYVSTKGSSKHLAYAASKAALDNLTLSFAAKLAPTVKVNGIRPSLIKFNDHDDQAYRASRLQKSALGIEPGYQTVLESVDFLLQNNYITGSFIDLNGGRHLR